MYVDFEKNEIHYIQNYLLVCKPTIGTRFNCGETMKLKNYDLLFQLLCKKNRKGKEFKMHSILMVTIFMYLVFS